MRQEHAHFIDNACDEQLQRIRTDLENLLKVLREPEVRQETRVLLKAIDQELLERSGRCRERLQRIASFRHGLAMIVASPPEKQS